MTSNISTPRILDDEWIIAIQEEIAAQPQTLSDVVEPEIMGMYDAEMGKPCQPERYYAKLGEIEAYIIAWQDTTAKLRAATRRLLTDAEMEAELEDLQDDMLDREDWARGWW